jgi:hypothetical protein
MTLVEFLAPLKNASHRERVLAVMYYRHRYDGVDSLTAEQIKSGLERARAPKWKGVNVADVLGKSGELVDTTGREGAALLWKLTPSGVKHVREKLSLPATDPEVEHDVGSLTAIAAKVKDLDVRAYVEEAITCLQVDALRACVVFLWVGAVRIIHTKMLTHAEIPLNAAIQKFDPKARKVTKLDHFAYIKDSVALLAAQELGMFDKSEKDTLQEALDLRNRCGHPAKYKPGLKKVSSLIEDLISTVFA